MVLAAFFLERFITHKPFHCHVLFFILSFFMLQIYIIHSSLSYLTHFFFPLLLLFFFSISGSHHSGSPLARGARYCMSADSSKAYTIPQASSSSTGSSERAESGLGSGPASEPCGPTRSQPSASVPSGDSPAVEEEDIEGPPNISQCG